MIDERIDEICTPVCAFVTFTTQEGYERCFNYLYNKTEEGLNNLNIKPFNLMSV